VLRFEDLAPLLGNRAQVDVPCPACSPFRKANHRRLPVLRIWRVDDGMLSFYCAHCEERGYCRADEDARPEDQVRAMQRKALRAQHQAETVQHRIARARELWDEGEPIRGTWADVYLAGRGLVAGNAMGLRFHPHCPFPDRKSAPALLVAFTAFADLTDPTRDPFADPQPIAIHRIRGRGHANKAMLGPVGGAAMMLDPPHEIASELQVTEGVETALAVRRWRGGPVWALGSAGAMQRFPLIRRIRRLIVWADHDASGVGQEAAKALGRRYSQAGREVTIRWPERQGDYAG
jgi:hypothetical protein